MNRIAENIDYSKNFSKNVDFVQNFRKISILLNIYGNLDLVL